MPSTDDGNDAELVKRIAAGETLALEALYGRYHVRLFRFLLRLVRNEAIAEELTNETFMEVWRTANRFEGKSAASTWMFAIGRNKAISLLRKRTELELDEEKSAEIEDSDDTPEVAAQKGDKASAIRLCMDKLTDEHREVIDLVYYHEKTIREVSEIAGIPENTVKTRMFHARKKLSEYLMEAGIDRGWP